MVIPDCDPTFFFLFMTQFLKSFSGNLIFRNLVPLRNLIVLVFVIRSYGQYIYVHIQTLPYSLPDQYICIFSYIRQKYGTPCMYISIYFFIREHLYNRPLPLFPTSLSPHPSSSRGPVTLPALAPPHLMFSCHTAFEQCKK